MSTEMEMSCPVCGKPSLAVRHGCGLDLAEMTGLFCEKCGPVAVFAPDGTENIPLVMPAFPGFHVLEWPCEQEGDLARLSWNDDRGDDEVLMKRPVVAWRRMPLGGSDDFVRLVPVVAWKDDSGFGGSRWLFIPDIVDGSGSGEKVTLRPDGQVFGREIHRSWSNLAEWMQEMSEWTSA